MLAEDNLFFKENGLDAWLEMQENRRSKGFTCVEEHEKLRHQITGD
ncbi:MAG: hypothetical protein LBE79_07145 [Tannerella sp.]|jgi:hypothetical protein|nr:hypothetical protein [Tannerella sp.]